MNLPSMCCLHSYAIPTAGPTCTPMITAMVIVSREDAPKQEAHIDEVVVDDVIHLSAGYRRNLHRKSRGGPCRGNV